MTIGSDEGLAALRTGRAFTVVPDLRVVRVGGPDAVGWLGDLLTADIGSLRVGAAARTLLLTPTGRIRADLWVLRRPDEVVVTQGIGAGEPIDGLLAPYALSSRVTLVPDDTLVLVAGAGRAGDDVSFTPSLLGAGSDLLVARRSLERVVSDARDRGLIEVGPDAVEHWRIVRGIASMAADFGTASLPSEARLDDAIAHDKGCYLGQESVARIRNLGHPPTLLLHLRSDGALVAGDRVLASGSPAGIVTSAVPGPGSVALVRVEWARRDADLTGPDGHPLHPVAGTA